jgi:hypothetical protein
MTTEKKHCFTPVKENKNYRVAKVIENEDGYYPLGKANPNDPHELDKFVGDYNHVRNICNTWNKHMEVDAKEEERIVWSSMGPMCSLGVYQ